MIKQQDLFIPGPAGDIEAVVQTVDTPVTHIGIVCHPHPLQGGTMQNKVVTTVAKAFNNLGMPAVRFNYRGVGKSAGSFGDINGEADDCLAVIAWAKNEWPEAKLWLAGFSFGAYIAAYAATQVPTEQLISIAPAVDRMPYSDLKPVNCPWLVIQGEDDEVVIPASVFSWFAQLEADKTLIKFPETGHFFHGKLIELRDTIEKL